MVRFLSVTSARISRNGIELVVGSKILYRSF